VIYFVLVIFRFFVQEKDCEIFWEIRSSTFAETAKYVPAISVPGISIRHVATLTLRVPEISRPSSEIYSYFPTSVAIDSYYQISVEIYSDFRTGGAAIDSRTFFLRIRTRSISYFRGVWYGRIAGRLPSCLRSV